MEYYIITDYYSTCFPECNAISSGTFGTDASDATRERFREEQNKRRRLYCTLQYTHMTREKSRFSL